MYYTGTLFNELFVNKLCFNQCSLVWWVAKEKHINIASPYVKLEINRQGHDLMLVKYEKLVVIYEALSSIMPVSQSIRSLRC
jgi:hypothetical protein